MYRFLVCWLALATSPALGLAQETPPGKQVEMSMGDAAGDVGYLLYLPKDYNDDTDRAWPLLLFLHGRGESNGPLSLVAKWGPPKFAKRGDELPFILVSPQCPRDGRWSDTTRQQQLGRLLEAVTDRYRVDDDRICLTGLSMGGYGAWSLAARHPRRFAAVVPVCGAGDPRDAGNLTAVPIWVFHGDQDRAVPFRKSVEMVEAIRGAGGTKVRFTSLEHVGHNCWSSTYALPELYSWMLAQRASANQPPPAGN
jgi:predicted peptidase